MGFGPVGMQNVLQHLGVDVHRVAIHVVGGESGNDKQGGQYRPDGPAGQQRGQHHKLQRGDCDQQPGKQQQVVEPGQSLRQLNSRCQKAWL
jgi:hypothetical protein